MIKTKVLPDCKIIIICYILAALPYFPVVKNQTADLAPFTQSIDLIPFRINNLSSIHSGAVCVIYKPVVQVSTVMCQHIWIRNIKKDLFYPVVFIHRIKGQPDLVKLSFRKLTSQTVIYDLQICLRQLRCFLTPYICQFSTLKCDGFQFFTLFLIIHATKNDLIAVCPAG